MDELDRLYRRLVQNIRSGSPELLSRQFEVSQIYQQIVPYRTNRRELGFDSNDEYELALLQLLGGARGLLTGDEEMQRVLRAELDSSNPDLGAFRVFATAAVMLAPEPLRAMEQERQVRSVSGVVERGAHEPTPSQGSPKEQVIRAARQTQELETPVGGKRAPASARPLPADTGDAPPRAASSASRGPQRDPVSSAAPATPASAGAKPPALPSSMSASRPTPVRAKTGDVCRYCAGVLPESRGIVFCPHCGHNLTVQHCPACGTELEVDWKFCITCGRDLEN
jgi:hypothetical protein